MEPESFSSLEEELRRYSPAILTEFQKAAVVAMEYLSPEEFHDWAREGIAIAQFSFRAWEAASEYFRVSPKVLERLSFPDLITWAQVGRRLSLESTALSSAYFRASPGALSFLSLGQIGDWASMGKTLYKETWRSSALAARFLESSPKLLRYLSLEEVAQFVLFLGSLAERSYDFANECLLLAGEVFSGIEREERGPFLSLALVLVKTSFGDAKAYFAQGPSILSRIARWERNRFLTLAKAIASSNGTHTSSFIFDGSQALGQLDEALHSRLLDFFEELLALSPTSAIEFLKSSPILMERIGISGVERWFGEGIETLKMREEAGEAYFRLESMRSEEILRRLSSRVELEQVREVLRMYSRALTGRNAQILSAQNLKEKGIGWTSVESPSTEGTGIFLPPLIDKYNTKGENFTWYKVMVTHQAGHLEFGSFDFSFEKEATLFPNLRFELEGQRGNAITDLERFFDLFPDRRLASDIFTAVEDSRVDYQIKREYTGIRSTYEKVQQEALAQRPLLHYLPLRELFIEILVQMSLKDLAEIEFPASMTRQLRSVAYMSNKVKSQGATVEDSAEATVRLYAFFSTIANKMYQEEWQTIDLSELFEDLKLSLEGIPQGRAPEGEELPYESPQEVDFRGDFKPELVQLLMRLKQDYSQKEAPPGSPLSPEALKELLEKSAEIELTALSPGDISSSVGLFVSNILGEVEKPIPLISDQGEEGTESQKTRSDEKSLAEEERCFLYSEWDFRANDYKPKWCRLWEKTTAEGTIDFFETTLRNHAHLATQIKKQFELMTPELFKKIKRLHDGEDFDLDAVIEAMVEKKAGVTPSEKIYWRRNKVERDVSVVFLLDMSASTSEAIEEARQTSDAWDFDGDVRGYIARLMAQREEQATQKTKQIIDVEKESLVLLIGALETIGDKYGIYGFSGYGRDNVEFFVVKDIDEEFSEKVKRRIDKIAPLHATRMGPAIRHATSKLEEQDSKTKILFLISDGRPQDHGYGRDSMEKDYAIHDTKMALVEATRRYITPFCLTVDKAGQDYLKKMCHDIGYEVVWNIESLPRRLPALYRILTT
ncbi:MAG: hypothetical protein AMJ37_01935 [Dehalococcoidia bacterium DG_18]|nr:MAG: hypothetical protein AMJ37_01935 [Dehalococcoidia bacterium DG_18]